LLYLINDILDLSKIEAGKMDISYDMINVYEISDELKKIFKSKFEKKNIQFDIQIAQCLPQKLFLDEVRIRQVLFNLVDNAVKFAEKGVVTLRFLSKNISNENETIDLLIEVKDTGIGIPDDQKEIIFLPFRQREGQNASCYGGTGLGLTITKRLVEMMGGEITLEREVGVGFIFNIFIPNVIFSNETDDNQLYNAVYDNIVFKKGKILIAEDTNVKVLKGFLEPYLFNLIFASNGKEAFTKSQDYKPDLDLTDIQMPEMDGITAANLIKRDGRLKDIPIIALTASAVSQSDFDELDIFNSITPKPDNKERILAEISKYIEFSKTETKSEESFMFKMTFLFITKYQITWCSCLKANFTKNGKMLVRL